MKIIQYFCCENRDMESLNSTCAWCMKIESLELQWQWGERLELLGGHITMELTQRKDSWEMEPHDSVRTADQTTSEVRSIQFLYPEIKIFLTDIKENIDLKSGSISISGIWGTTCCKQCQCLPRSPLMVSVSVHSPPFGVTATSSWATGATWSTSSREPESFPVTV